MDTKHHSDMNSIGSRSSRSASISDNEQIITIETVAKYKPYLHNNNSSIIDEQWPVSIETRRVSIDTDRQSTVSGSWYMPVDQRRRLVEELIWRKFENERLALRDPAWDIKQKYLREIQRQKDEHLWSAYELLAKKSAAVSLEESQHLNGSIANLRSLDSEVFFSGSFHEAQQQPPLHFGKLSKKLSISDPGSLAQQMTVYNDEKLWSASDDSSSESPRNRHDGEHRMDLDIFRKIENGTIRAENGHSSTISSVKSKSSVTSLQQGTKLPEYLRRKDDEDDKSSLHSGSSYAGLDVRQHQAAIVRRKSSAVADNSPVSAWLRNGYDESAPDFTDDNMDITSDQGITSDPEMTPKDLILNQEVDSKLVSENGVPRTRRSSSVDSNWSLKFPIYGNMALGGSVHNLNSGLLGRHPSMRDVDELSELSENPEATTSDSDQSEGSDSESSERDARRVLRRQKRESDGDVTTATPDSHAATPDINAVMEQILNKPGAPASKPRSLTPEPISTEGTETDPAFTVRPRDVSVPEGEVARFSCQLNATEPLDVYWYRTGSPDLVTLNDTDACDARRHGDTFSLDVYNVTAADQGQILCIGVNTAGRCTQSANLRVTDNANNKKPPEFIKPLQNTEVKVGSKVKLRVKVSGYPEPRVLWYRDGKKISESEHVHIEKYGNRDHALVLSYVTLSDDAEYSVTATNLSGSAESHAQLIVENAGDPEEADTISLVSSAAPSSVVLEDYSGLYPDTDDLLRLAESVSQTRGDVEVTAGKMLRSAGKMSTINQELDSMDQKLDDLETKVKDTDHIAMETEAYKEIYRDEILREHDELQTSASAVRHITTTALDLLSSADYLADQSGDGSPQGLKRKSADDSVELKLSYREFNKLYAAGKISRSQMHSGKVPRGVYEEIQRYLRTTTLSDSSDDDDDQAHELTADGFPTNIDCGLKRVDSKRYKRDFIVNRDSPQVSRKRWSVTSPQDGVTVTTTDSDVIRATPAGMREDAREKINEAQEQIYMAASRVSHLQDKVQELEDKVKVADADDEATITALEEEVARTAAQVKGHDRQVKEVEIVSKTETKTETISWESRPEEDWKLGLSKTKDDDSVKSEIKIQLRSEVKKAEEDDEPPKLPTTPPPNVQSAPSKLPTPSKKASPSSPKVQRYTPPTRIPSLPSPTVKQQPPKSPVPKSPSPQPAPKSPSPQPAPKSPSAQLQPVYLRGESTENTVPESRTEYDVSLPSVKNLLSKFNHQHQPEPITEEERENNLKRVYSLTGRDIPRTVREKLRKQKPTVLPNVNIRNPDDKSPDQPPANDNAPRRPPLGAVFEQPIQAQYQRSSSQSETRKSQSETRKSQSLPRSSTPVENATSPVNSLGLPTSGYKSKVRSVSSSSSGSDGHYQAPISPLATPTKPKHSTIMARAAFWDTRINQGAASDKDAPVEKFPEMPNSNFKR